MNSVQLWTEPKPKRTMSPQVIVAIGLLAILLIGTATWEVSASPDSAACRTAECSPTKI